MSLAINPRFQPSSDGKVIAQHHRDAVGLLPARARRAPDVQRPLRASTRQQLGHHRVPQHPEHADIPEERRLVVRHRFCDPAVEIAEGHRPQVLDQLLERGKSLLARERLETRFDEIFLAGLEQQRRVFPHEVSDVVELAGGHSGHRRPASPARGATGTAGAAAGFRRWFQTLRMISGPSALSGRI